MTYRDSSFRRSSASPRPTARHAHPSDLSEGWAWRASPRWASPDVCLGDGQTEAEVVLSQVGRGDALLRRKLLFLYVIFLRYEKTSFGALISRPEYRRRARHAHLQIGLRLAIAQADTGPVMSIPFRHNHDHAGGPSVCSNPSDSDKTQSVRRDLL